MTGAAEGPTVRPVRHVAVDFLPGGGPAAITVAPGGVQVYLSRNYSIDDVARCLNVLQADLADAESWAIAGGSKLVSYSLRLDEATGCVDSWCPGERFS